MCLWTMHIGVIKLQYFVAVFLKKNVFNLVSTYGRCFVIFLWSVNQKEFVMLLVQQADQDVLQQMFNLKT